MIDLLDQIERWLKNDQSVALATVIKTWGSSPRPKGAGMAVSEAGEIAGSVSGGCVEGAVFDAAKQVIQSGSPARLHFGVADADAWEVGLACGGEIEVFIRIFSSIDYKRWRKALETEGSFCAAVVIDGDEKIIGEEFILFEDDQVLISDSLSETGQNLIEEARKSLSAGRINTKIIHQDNQIELFTNIISPAPTMVLVGGVHIAIPLVDLARVMGFEVIVVDPRKLFSTSKRFPDVKALITEWPEKAFQKIKFKSSTAVIMLTHDPKIDDPALKIALDSPAFYIGALGSKKTHQKRLERLQQEGVEKTKLSRIHAPVGLNLGGKTPEEIALAIIAEVVQVRHKKE